METKREIKFRFWDGKKMQITDFHVTCFGIVWKYSDDRDGSDEDRILMQYTGLKDKNGKEIYEGDIVQYPTRFQDENRHFHSITYKTPVTWEGSGWSVSGRQENDRYLESVNDTCEVIGNIYEHASILQKG